MHGLPNAARFPIYIERLELYYQHVKLLIA